MPRGGAELKVGMTRDQAQQLAARIAARARDRYPVAHTHKYAWPCKFMRTAASNYHALVAEADVELVADLRSALGTAAEPERAPQMQRYMKSAMPYLGIRLPIVRRLARAAERARPLSSRPMLVATVRRLWDDAEYREERYAATELLNTASARRLRSMELLPLYRELIVRGAWWDHVDEVAHRVADIRADFPAEMDPVRRGWSTDGDMWLRRAAIISQLGARQATDVDLLTGVIQPNLADREFFIRKAIGWALRDYAWTNPEWARGYVTEHETQLSPLSRREAMRNPRDGAHR
jgi:3-methyladenine DNA glycosylase AlkD